MKTELPKARGLYETKLAELKDLHQEVEHLRAIVEHMSALVGESFEPPGAAANDKLSTIKPIAPAQQAVTRVVNQLRRPVRVRDVAAELGEESSKNAIGAALWAAAKNGLIRKLGGGLYAPRDYIPPPDSLLPEMGGKK